MKISQKQEELYNSVKSTSKSTIQLIHTMENFLFIIDFSGNILLTSDSVYKNTKAIKEVVGNSKFYEVFSKSDNTSLDFFDLLLLNNNNSNTRFRVQTF